MLHSVLSFLLIVREQIEIIPGYERDFSIELQHTSIYVDVAFLLQNSSNRITAVATWVEVYN